MKTGRKEVEGPPYRQIGNAPNSPVRYNLARLREWMKRFSEVVNRAGTVSSLPSVTAFFTGEDHSAKWLFALPDGEPPIEFFEALNGGKLEEDGVELAWLNKAEWARAKSESIFGR